MKRLSALLIVISAFVIAPQSANSQSPAAKLSVINNFRVGGASKWDYPIVDPESHRLYIACDNHVQVIDTNTGKRIADIGDLQGAHGIAIVGSAIFQFAANVDRERGQVDVGRIDHQHIAARADGEYLAAGR